MPDDFEAFWQLYPRKVGKGAARRKYAAALKLADAETIMRGLEAYVAHVNREGTTAQFICHPSTWLHQERWDDEHPGPVKATPRRGSEVYCQERGWIPLSRYYDA